MFNRKTWKTLLSMVLVFGMLFAVGGASAFADSYVVQNETKTEDSLTLTGEEWRDVVVVRAEEDENSALTVNGDVTVTGEGYLFPANVYAYDGGSASLTINGDLKAEGTDGSDGLYISAGEGSEATATVNGNIDLEGESTYGVIASAYNGGAVNVVVDGDVICTNIGVQISATGENSSADVVINGTVSGDIAVLLYQYGETNGDTNLTAWKLEANEDGKLVIASGSSYYDEELTYEWDPALSDEENEAAADEFFAAAYQAKAEAAAAEFEANINYIIRVDNDNTALAGTTQIQGYDTAKEGETVTVKAAAGYRVVAATNNGAALLQDADGNYFLVVPKGGGVSLSVLTELMAVAKAEVGKFTTKTADGKEIEIVFYDDGAFKLTVDGEVMRGHAVVEDGKLILVSSHGVKCPVEDDGTVKFQTGKTADSVIEFKLDKDLVDSLIELLG